MGIDGSVADKSLCPLQRNCDNSVNSTFSGGRVYSSLFGGGWRNEDLEC